MYLNITFGANCLDLQNQIKEKLLVKLINRETFLMKKVGRGDEFLPYRGQG